MFSLLLSVIHAVSEVFVVTLFYFGNSMTAQYYNKGYFETVIILVGVGTVVHSLIDFGIATFVWKPLTRVVRIPYNAKIKLQQKAEV